MTFQKNTFMWVFIVLAMIILVGQIVSLTILLNLPVKIESNVNKLEQSANKLDSKLATLDNINNRVSGIENNIALLSNKYPPNQTINVNNMNQQELNNAINNAVNLEFENVKWKINVNLIFNSLLSLTFVLYLIFWRKK